MSHREDDEAIARELREKQKFSMAGAIGRSAGGAMKGASPIPRREQAVMSTIQWMEQHLRDSSGALKALLKRRIKAQAAIAEAHLEQPQRALMEIIQPLLENPAALHEFTRQVDVKWGEMFDERPHFQQPGQKAHPEDEYTHDSVRQDLEKLFKAARLA
ncbi:MAG: hypothetical protein HQL53_06720 [Magnetococcales bacterium]|nr:hypothetical protein [Magnetococcales bacterium]